MKRILILLLCIVSTITIYANPPKLNVEKLFDGRYNNNKSVTISIYKSNGNYYRGLTIKDNPEIIKSIAEAIEKDAPRGSDYSDYQGNDEQYTSLKIVNNGEAIYIGLQRDKSGGGFFFQDVSAGRSGCAGCGRKDRPDRLLRDQRPDAVSVGQEHHSQGAGSSPLSGESNNQNHMLIDIKG